MTFVEAAGIAAIGQTIELTDQAGSQRPASHRIVDRLAVGLTGAGDVIGRLGAAFDLQRIDPDFGQAGDVFDRAKILRVENIRAMLIFFDGHQLAGTQRLFQHKCLPGAARRAHALDVRRRRNGVDGGDIARCILAGVMHLVIPTAGIGAATLIRIAVIEIAGEQAATGIGDA